MFNVTQARYRKEQSSTQLVPWIPPVDNLLKDSADGSALGALLHFYCPQLLPLEGKELTVGLEQDARQHGTRFNLSAGTLKDQNK